MNVSTLLVGVFIATLVALIIAYIILNNTRPSVLNKLSPKVGSLSKSVSVGSSAEVRDLFLTPPGATFSCYFYYAANNKTPSVYAKQDPITLFRMGDVLRFEILPGGVSSPPTTRLVIKTQGPKFQPEEIPVKNFPEQKWVHVVIVREGRRFTVYYNGESVSSQRTQYFPVVNSSIISIGDTRLRGEFALPALRDVPLKIEEIQNELRDTSDTRYNPNKPMDFSSFFKIGCPNGLFCFSTSSPPQTDPLKMWTTSYA
jgi:hypothetical protein